MKTPVASFRWFTAALLLLVSAVVGCVRDPQSNNTTQTRRRIPLAPIGAASPGIGAPGAGSEDTRGTGTIATGEGDTPLDEPTVGSVPVSGAGNVPGAASAPNARAGGHL